MKQDNRNRPRKYGFWNWGTGITIAISAGCLAMLSLVYRTTKINFDMVERDYYAAELKYDSKMKARDNLQSLNGKIDISLVNDLLLIQFPEDCIGQTLEGNLVLYRPSDQQLDLHLPLTPDNQGRILVQKSKLQKGKYVMKASWQMANQSYDAEESFFIP